MSRTKIMPFTKINLFYVLFLGAWMAAIAQEGRFGQELYALSGEKYFSTANALIEDNLDNSLKDGNALVVEILANPAISNYPAEHATAYYLRGKILYIQGSYDEAYDPLDKAITLYGENNDEAGLAKSYLAKGVAYTYQGQKDNAKITLDKSLELYTDVDDESGVGQTLHELGHFYYIFADDTKALEYYEKALDVQKKIDDKKGISQSYFRMGLAYLSSDKGESLRLLDQSKRLKEEIGDLRGLAKVGISLGVLHEENGNYQNALDYYKQSLEANEKFDDKRVASIIYNNLGIVYLDLMELDSAIVYHNKALEFRKILGNERGVVQSLLNIGEVYQKKKDFYRGLTFFHKAKAISEASSRKPFMPNIVEKLGEVHLSLNALDSADIYFTMALIQKQEAGNFNSLSSTYRNLSKLFEKRRDYKKSLEYFKQFKTVQDSVTINKKNRELAEVQAKYDTAKQEREINELQQENKSRKLWQNIYAVGGLLALILTVILFQFFRFRNKKNQELLAIKESQRQQLEEVNQLKTRFFHNISHEFRTPLTLILGPLEQLKSTVDSSIQPTLDMIERNGKRLLKLINQLLDLSKIEEGKISLKASHIDIVPLIKGWATSFQSMAEIKGVGLSLNLKKESHFLYVDKEKLEEIIINLLSNALKYTPSGGSVSLDVDESENQLYITVSDTGDGIPKEELEYIFNRFYQASNANTESQIGTGIGLALVKELVELHKGTITVDSEVDKGSVFKVALPLGKEHLSPNEIVTISSTIATTIERQQSDLPTECETIGSENEELPILLLIEDNADLRTYIKSVLKNHYCIREAFDGEEGISQAVELIPDIIISDLMMPKVDGLEVCKTLKEDVRTSHIPIILLTARSSKEDKIEGLKSLADDYLTKPFNNEELLVRIENLVEVRSKMQQHFSTGEILKPKKVTLNSIDQDFIKKVTDVLEVEIANENFGVVELADAVALSRSQLFRKIKAITNLTPNEFIRSFRLHRAMDMLKQQSGTIAEIAYSVGFQNPSYFSKCFHEQFGELPSDISQTN
ncbi:tetratricopeptide repeat protein [Flagellimonas hymeniacidonis]|uniref:histidine kinase n=1 Tax=Flagellimonas hymeniacidonis TaxID=2603628 RepID=A0A5C8V3Y5_9FLAO|nr:tetratricopeptide repeat protein [Flagellimonas hymeniacidonis]TXN35207.1 tetratricopeptide repeat protein [Flagellimonas hymeniacidonis]